MSKPFIVQIEDSILLRTEEYIVRADSEDHVRELVKANLPLGNIKSIESFEGCGGCGGCGSAKTNCE